MYNTKVLAILTLGDAITLFIILLVLGIILYSRVRVRVRFIVRVSVRVGVRVRVLPFRTTSLKSLLHHH